MERIYNKTTNFLKCLQYQSYSTITKNTSNKIEKISIKKILIANRGEIACRIIKTAKKLGIRSVAVFSDVDENTLHCKMADEAYNIGLAPSTDSYLSMTKIINVAKMSNCQAIHPGYGFLSENADFVDLCENENIKFIGPPPSSIRNMGIKNISKQIMINAGVPVIPGYHDNNQNDDILYSKALEIGFPIMIKAVCGGGGKGMRICQKSEDFYSLLQSARSESQKSFGDSSVLIERLITSPRHIEVQILADNYGNFIHLYERDCSIQRRHQKIIEETPATGLSNDLRNKLGETAILAGKAVDYIGAGTVEFILDKNTSSFYFMEMNTRLQVEHPITEMITGIDLVEWQIKIASGDILNLKQNQIKQNGHSIEARIYAENTKENFLPCAGLLKYLSIPKSNTNIRIDTGFIQNDNISIYYDPMIAKLIIWSENRSISLKLLLKNLIDYHISGLETNINFLIRLIQNQKFENENIHTNFIDENFNDLFSNDENSLITEDDLCKAGIALFLNEQAAIKLNSNYKFIINNDPFVMFYQRINSKMIRKYEFINKNNENHIVLIKLDDKKLMAKVNSSSWKLINSEFIKESERCKIKIKINNSISYYYFHMEDNEINIFTEIGKIVLEIRQPLLLFDNDNNNNLNNVQICAPMTGILERILVNPGDKVKKGDTLAIFTAMKMEHMLKAPNDAIIKNVNGKMGSNIDKGKSIITLENNTET